MFLLFYMLEGHHHGVSIQRSINLGETLLQITPERKTADLNLSEVVYFW